MAISSSSSLRLCLIFSLFTVEGEFSCTLIFPNSLKGLFRHSLTRAAAAFKRNV